MWPLLFHCVLFAGSGTGSGTGSGPGTGDGHGARSAGNDGWHELDAARAGLLQDPEGPLAFGALVRVFFTQSAQEASAGTTDVSGWVFEDVDVFASYRQGGITLRASADFDDQSGRLEDAYARWQYHASLALTAGQFKPRVLRSGSLPESELLFRERTFLGAAFDGWDDGVELGGHYDQFDYWLALTDGSNGNESDHFWSARTEWALFDAAFEDIEGARGAPNHLRVLLGLQAFSDAAQSNSDAGGYGADLALTFGPYSFHGEWADLGEEFTRTIDVFNGYLVTLGDGKPQSATLSRRVGERAEAAVRMQRADDPDSTESFGASLSWSPARGLARFVADLALVEGDSRDFSLFSLGLQVGSSGLSRPFTGEPRAR